MGWFRVVRFVQSPGRKGRRVGENFDNFKCEKVFMRVILFQL
jgi:hypothetical protein